MLTKSTLKNLNLEPLGHGESTYGVVRIIDTPLGALPLTQRAGALSNSISVFDGEPHAFSGEFEGVGTRTRLNTILESGAAHSKFSLNPEGYFTPIDPNLIFRYTYKITNKNNALLKVMLALPVLFSFVCTSLSCAMGNCPSDVAIDFVGKKRCPLMPRTKFVEILYVTILPEQGQELGIREVTKSLLRKFCSARSM